MRQPHDNDESRTLHLAHHHPGRIRLRSKAFEGKGSAENVLAVLSAEPGVEHVEHGPITGGVLVHYRPGEIDADDIMKRVAEAAGLVIGTQKVPDPSDLPNLIIDKSRKLNAVVAKVTGYHADVRGIVPLALVTLAGYSFLTRKDRLPKWDNLAYWAFSIFSDLHREEIDTPPAPQAAEAREQPARGALIGAQ